MRNTLLVTLALGTAVLLAGCGVTKEVIVGTGSLEVRHQRAALAAADGNSEAMDKILIAEMRARGFGEVRQVAEGVKRLEGVDVVVEYVDVWRWDLVMYLDSISIRLFDARDGNIIAIAKWAQKDQVFHTYPRPEDVVGEVFTDLMVKIKRVPTK